MTRTRIPNREPNDFRRRAVEERTLAKIVVLRHNGIAVFARMIPHRAICGAAHAEKFNMSAAGKVCREQFYESRTKIFIK